MSNTKQEMPPREPLAAVGRRHQDDEIGAVGAGDEALGAVDDVMVAVAHRGGAHRAGIGAGVRLGLREAALALAARRSASDSARASRLRARRAARGCRGRECARRASAARRCGQAPTRRSTRPSTPRPWPPNSSGTSICQSPSSLQRAVSRASISGLSFCAVERLAFERDQFLVDEAPHHVAQHAQFVGKIDLHGRTRRLQERRAVTCFLLEVLGGAVKRQVRMAATGRPRRRWRWRACSCRDAPRRRSRRRLAGPGERLEALGGRQARPVIEPVADVGAHQKALQAPASGRCRRSARRARSGRARSDSGCRSRSRCGRTAPAGAGFAATSVPYLTLTPLCRQAATRLSI